VPEESSFKIIETEHVGGYWHLKERGMIVLGLAAKVISANFSVTEVGGVAGTRIMLPPWGKTGSRGQ